MKKIRIAATLYLSITGAVVAGNLPEYCDTWQKMITAVEFYNANVNGCIANVQVGNEDQTDECKRTNVAFTRVDGLYTRLSAFDELPQSLRQVSKSCSSDIATDMYVINSFNQAKNKYTSALIIYKEVLQKHMDMIR